MRRKIVFTVLALLLIALAAVSTWQVYVPLEEDAQSVWAYRDLTAYVHLPEISLPTSSQKERCPLEGEPEQSEGTLPQVDFAALQAINPDIVGWILIEGTDINYPVVQGADNQYYLRHLFTGEYNASGCIFLDSRNTPGFSDQHSIFYGHHMDNGTMFNGLMNYKEQAFYDAHPHALLLTPDRDYSIDFFAGYVANVKANAWQVNFGLEEFAVWLREAKGKSLFQSEIEPIAESKVLTLSTCSYEFDNARFVLHGVMVDLPRTTSLSR